MVLCILRRDRSRTPGEAMRGHADRQARLALTTLSADDRVPRKLPIRSLKALADAAVRDLSPVFDESADRTHAA